ncbi:hypothetical protein BGZ65_010868, partial [Modicella reniformis]
FLLTYLLHTSLATKNGSKAGLGITLLLEQDKDSDTRYMGNGGENMRSMKEYSWLSYFLVFLAGIMLQAGLDKKTGQED